MILGTSCLQDQSWPSSALWRDSNIHSWPDGELRGTKAGVQWRPNNRVQQLYNTGNYSKFISSYLFHSEKFSGGLREPNVFMNISSYKEGLCHMIVITTWILIRLGLENQSLQTSLIPVNCEIKLPSIKVGLWYIWLCNKVIKSSSFCITNDPIRLTYHCLYYRGFPCMPPSPCLRWSSLGNPWTLVPAWLDRDARCKSSSQTRLHLTPNGWLTLVGHVFQIIL